MDVGTRRTRQKTKLTSDLQSKARTERQDDTEVEYGQKHENNSSLVFAIFCLEQTRQS